MHPYQKYYIKIRDDSCKEIISDLIGGEFHTAEAINKFMQIHFPKNTVYLNSLKAEEPKKINGKLHVMYSIKTNVGKNNKMFVVVYEDDKR